MLVWERVWGEEGGGSTPVDDKEVISLGETRLKLGDTALGRLLNLVVLEGEGRIVLTPDEEITHSIRDIVLRDSSCSPAL